MDWYESYSIGIDRIDAQHKELVRRVSRLQSALVGGGVTQEVGSALKFLVDYTKTHFADEEKVMEAIHFAELDRHRELHRKLIEDVMKILLDLKKGKMIDPYVFVDFLTDWLLNHIPARTRKSAKPWLPERVARLSSAAGGQFPPPIFLCSPPFFQVSCHKSSQGVSPPRLTPLSGNRQIPEG